MAEPRWFDARQSETGDLHRPIAESEREHERPDPGGDGNSQLSGLTPAPPATASPLPTIALTTISLNETGTPGGPRSVR